MCYVKQYRDWLVGGTFFAMPLAGDVRETHDVGLSHCEILACAPGESDGGIEDDVERLIRYLPMCRLQAAVRRRITVVRERIELSLAGRSWYRSPDFPSL